MTSEWALRLAELALRVVPPLLRAGRARTLATDVEGRRTELRREIQRQIAERAKARRIR